MRTPSKEFMGCLENSAAYQYILHTKKNGFFEIKQNMQGIRGINS